MARSRVSRVAKSTRSSSSAARATRHTSRLSSIGSSSNGLQDMVDELVHNQDLQRGRLVRDKMVDDVASNTSVVASIQNANIENQKPFGIPSGQRNKGKAPVNEQRTEWKPFPIMELPAEIRLEIYRACLTRPYKILLSKVEKRAQSEESKTNELEAGEGLLELKGRPNTTAATALLLPTVDPPVVTTLSNTRPSRRIPSMNRSRTGPPSRPPTLRHPAPSTSQFPALSAYSDPSADGTNTSDNMFADFDAYYNGARKATQRGDIHPETKDTLIINILRASKQIYKEARDVLYSENVFDLDITTAVNTLAALHQRSRRHIKHVELEIPTYTEILERFSEVVRLSLRYCTGLQKFVIHTPFILPGADGSMSSASNATVYANGFDILRWLPQQCQVVLQGNPNAEIEAVVRKHLGLAKAQDMAMYDRRRLTCTATKHSVGEDEKWMMVEKSDVF